tara:strand:- start:20880 stop:21638 length:759 start_codon:yes stop_codon:yes gene_type:complete
MLRKIVYLSALLLCFTGCAAKTVKPSAESPPPKKEIVPSIEGFITITEDDYPSVGRLLSGDMRPKCSVVLIEQDIVLTAAHCISNDESYVQFGDEMYSIKCATKHPQYNADMKVGYDVAVIVLDTYVRGIFPSGINSKPLLDVRKGTPVISVGYSRGFKKRSELNTLFYYGTLESEPTGMKMLPMGGSVWFGDSGGPVFMLIDNRFVVVGIISTFSMYRDMIYENSAIRVDVVYNWIREEIDSERKIERMVR